MQVKENLSTQQDTVETIWTHGNQINPTSCGSKTVSHVTPLSIHFSLKCSYASVPTLLPLHLLTEVITRPELLSNWPYSVQLTNPQTEREWGGGGPLCNQLSLLSDCVKQRCLLSNPPSTTTKPQNIKGIFSSSFHSVQRARGWVKGRHQRECTTQALFVYVFSGESVSCLRTPIVAYYF